MSTGARKRAPTRLIYVDSSEDEVAPTLGPSSSHLSHKPPRSPDNDPLFEPASLSLSSSPPPEISKSSLKRKASAPSRVVSINDALMAKKPTTPAIEAPHSAQRHSVAPIVACRPQLLDWYDKAKGIRAMPWRKDYDATLSPEEKTQRAYEVLVSEIMLQQTQVTTVIPYFNKWMETFPTVQALADADIEAVNQRWKGLGYYSRAARLLAAAKKVVDELDGQFPSDAASMEKLLPGVGRYTAGAVCSIVFDEQTAAVDGNVQRLFSRLLALHAPLKGNKAKEPLELIWRAAHKLVKGTPNAGALNQSLIELGSTVCKPTNPACGACPLRSGCGAFKLSQSRSTNETDIEDICGLCEPFPDSSTSVTRFPMKVEKKKAREESCAVNVISWRDPETSERWVLLIRRPDTGLLAGLHEFPTAAAGKTDSSSLDSASSTLLSTYLTTSNTNSAKSTDVGAVLHIYSHIRMTYHVRRTALSGSSKPEIRQPSESELASLIPDAQDEDEAAVDDSDDEEAPTKKRKTKKGSVKSNKKSKAQAGTAISASTNLAPRVRWVRASDVESENISTGALKIWKLAEGETKLKKKK